MKFNDDYYCKSVTEWEDQVVPRRVMTEQIGWAVRLLPLLLLLGASIAGTSWRIWVTLFVVTYGLVIVLAFLYEVNENIRFTRHQLRAFREAVRLAVERIDKHEEPRNSLTLYNAISIFDNE